MCDDIKIEFGMTRSIIRKLLNNEHEYNYSRNNNEDSYENFQNTSTWFRLFYKKDILTEIEFLKGCLQYNDIELLNNVLLNTVLDKMINKKIKSNKYDGYDIMELGISLANSKNDGSKLDYVEYVYIKSSNKLF